MNEDRERKGSAMGNNKYKYGGYRAAFLLAGTGFWVVVAWSFGFTPVQIIASSVLALITLCAASVLLSFSEEDEAHKTERDDRRR